MADRIEDCRAQLQRIFARALKKKKLIEKFLTDAAVPDHNKAIVRSTMMDSPPLQLAHERDRSPTEKGLTLFPQQMRTALRLLLGVPHRPGLPDLRLRSAHGPVCISRVELQDGRWHDPETGHVEQVFFF